MSRSAERAASTRRISTAALLFLGFPAFFGYFGDVHWIFDVFANFRIQIGLALFPVLIFLALRRDVLMFVCFAIITVMNFDLALPHFLPQKTTPAGEESIRVVSFNINAANPDLKAVRTQIDNFNPDVVLVLEIPESGLLTTEANLWAAHKLEIARSDSWGIGLYSKFPMEGARAENLGGDLPSILATIPWNGVKIDFIGVHAMVPLSAAGYELRTSQLVALAGYATQFDGPAIVAGDFNLTPWSPLFQAVKTRSGLRDSGDGFGFQPTWPTVLPLSIERIPIDHVLLSKHFHVRRRFLGPPAGSDHFPIVIDLQLAALSAETTTSGN